MQGRNKIEEKEKSKASVGNRNTGIEENWEKRKAERSIQSIVLLYPRGICQKMAMFQDNRDERHYSGEKSVPWTFPFTN